MALYLVQHGRNLSASEDPQKGLSPQGIEETERIAGVAAGYHVVVSRILHSGKKRARQTAEILAAHLLPGRQAKAHEGMAPLDDVRTFAGTLDTAENVMLVGHLPFMERLIGLLVCENPERTVFKMQNSGIVCIDQVAGTDHPVIRWALMPAIG